VQAIGTGFEPGEDPAVLDVGGHSLSVAICYEVVYPALVRQFVVRGRELLTTITNDAWVGGSSAPYQHFAQASARALEEGRSLVRAAHAGRGGIVDPCGRVLARSGVYEQTMVVGEARSLRASTLYARWGDAFAYLSTGVTGILLLLAARLT